MGQLQRTPLYDWHIAQGAKMVGFAGYEMPVQYPMGVMAEHQHCRAQAGLFDVSHMGQVVLEGPSWEAVAEGFERLVPQDVSGLRDGRQRYGFFTNERGGIEDDLMFSRRGDALVVVVNAACKTADLARLRAGLPRDVTVTMREDLALLALQGPRAADVLASMDAGCEEMRFLDCARLTLAGHTVWASRSGYTGEDGFELSVPADEAVALAQRLVDDTGVKPIGLGARDSLRLEAGLCLYGSDIDGQTDPVSAGLDWAIQGVRRKGGARAGGFPGAEAIFAALEGAVSRRRVGLRPEGRAPMRAGVQLYAHEDSDAPLGRVTSGGFGPTVGAPVAMGYVAADHAGTGTRLWGEVRGKRMPVEVARLPFVAPGFKR
jgi:aminomethyltransferase